ncbi:hypothetical protein DPEC_G00067840 [Dallia pectoralis]|uniref:Uncharacterized protein n=1 Tax=Dallia pectoralis TaxID=75939 RepID=A0ACC2H1T0_DALPE|nr:hypothetical protein DPEC_G00067840 [Dallia pectoralis]
MSRLEEDSWWMSLTKVKTEERNREDLRGYRHAGSWWLAVGHANPPEVLRESWTKQWWMYLAPGTRKNVTAAESSPDRLARSDSPHSNLIARAEASSGLTESAGAVSDPNACEARVIQRLYSKVNDANLASRPRVHDKASLKSIKTVKTVPFGNPERNSKKKSGTTFFSC